MRLLHYCHLLAIGVLALSGRPALCSTSPSAPLSADEIVKNAIARVQSTKDDSRRADYSYTKQVVVEDLDNQGHVTETKEKLFRYSSGFGSLEQIKVNGRAIGADRIRKEEERVAQQSSQLVGSKPSKRDDYWEKYFTPDLLAKYQFTLVDRKLVHGRPAYVIDFQPRSGTLPVRQIADRLLNQLAGKVWIDEQEFEIARAELGSQSKVTLGGVMEVLGSLKRFSYVLERTRLQDGIWFNRVANGDFECRKLLDNTHVKTRSETSGFHRISVSQND